MTSSSSSSSSSLSPECTTSLECSVCEAPARGKHFGAVSCRACAAFFRRADAIASTIAPCKKNNNCRLVNGNGWFHCKKCRLQKCYKAGMTSNNFQFDRDLIRTKILTQQLPMSMEEFVGRPHHVISCHPENLSIRDNVIDCRSMVDRGIRILMQGSEKPIVAKNSLLKLATGLKRMEERHNPRVKVIKTYGKAETMAFWEKDFLRAAKWFTYFDEFQQLKRTHQIKILSTVWHVWSRLDKLAITAMGRRKNMCGDLVMFSHDSEYSVIDLKNMLLDLTWCSRLTNQEMQFFYDTSENNIIYKLAEEMVALNPTDVELTYMLCQLVLHHAGQWFQGEILEITDRFQQILANHLHDYYVNDRETPRYSARLAQMLSITKKIRADVLRDQEKLKLAMVFDVHTARFTHPECFTVI